MTYSAVQCVMQLQVVRAKCVPLHVYTLVAMKWQVALLCENSNVAALYLMTIIGRTAGYTTSDVSLT